jgi:hypothetical protein
LSIEIGKQKKSQNSANEFYHFKAYLAFLH